MFACIMKLKVFHNSSVSIHVRFDRLAMSKVEFSAFNQTPFH